MRIVVDVEQPVRVIETKKHHVVLETADGIRHKLEVGNILHVTTDFRYNGPSECRV